MRLRRLWLDNFYNLKDVEIIFDDSPSMYGSTSIRFFVGLNGSGKSNALEAIGLIFSHLAADTKPGIEFDIEYELRGRIIRVTTRPDAFAHTVIPLIEAALLIRQASESDWQPEHLRTEWASSGDAVIPGKVVGYSTGPTTGLQWALSRSIERLVRNRLGAFESEPRPEGMADVEWQENRKQMRALLEAERDDYLDNPDTLFLSADDALCAVLPLLAHEGLEGAELEDYLKRRAVILNRISLDPEEPLPAFSLHVSANWYERLTVARQERFRDLLRKATVRIPIDPDPAIPVPEGEPPPRDFYAVFDLDETFRRETIRDKKLFPTPLMFFEELLAWKRQGGLKKIRLVLRKKNLDSLLPESALSDGEFLFLGRYALLLMLREIPESLVLLDEPETHFNDRWKVDLVKDICQLLGVDSSSTAARNEVIIATHSDLTLTDADPRQVYVFTEHEVRNDEGTIEKRILVERPQMSPFAANRGEISRVLFGTEGPIGTYSKEEIEKALRGNSKEEVERLLDTVGPGFYRFRLRDKLVQLEEAAADKGDGNASSR